MNQHPTSILGYRADKHGPASKVGVVQPIFTNRHDAFEHSVNAIGEVAGYRQVILANKGDYTSALAPFVANIGCPHIRGLVLDPTHPHVVLFMYWPQIAASVLENFSELQPHLLANPAAGIQTAGFLLDEVPGFVARGTEFKNSWKQVQETFAKELAELQSLRTVCLQTAAGKEFGRHRSTENILKQPVQEEGGYRV